MNEKREQSRIEEAAAKKKSGAYNCAQAIACTYCDIAGVDEQTLRNAAQAFGVGMGTLEGTCGALIGAGLVLGMKNRDARKTVRETREIMQDFLDRNGTVTCKTLKGRDDRGLFRACEDCVRDAAEFLEKVLSASDETV